MGAGSRGVDRRAGAGARAAGTLCEGQLLRARHAGAVLAPDLPDSGRGRAGRAPDARSGGPGALRPPDVEWIAPATPEAIDYHVDAQRCEAFEVEIRRYWPGLPAGALQTAYSGVRPKLQGAGAAAQDFVLQGPAEHGMAGLLNLYGIESRGLTASLALADEALSRLQV